MSLKKNRFILEEEKNRRALPQAQIDKSINVSAVSSWGQRRES